MFFLETATNSTVKRVRIILSYIRLLVYMTKRLDLWVYSCNIHSYTEFHADI